MCTGSLFIDLMCLGYVDMICGYEDKLLSCFHLNVQLHSTIKLFLSLSSRPVKCHDIITFVSLSMSLLPFLSSLVS